MTDPLSVIDSRLQTPPATVNGSRSRQTAVLRNVGSLHPPRSARAAQLRTGFSKRMIEVFVQLQFIEGG